MQHGKGVGRDWMLNSFPLYLLILWSVTNGETQRFVSNVLKTKNLSYQNSEINDVNIQIQFLAVLLI